MDHQQLSKTDRIILTPGEEIVAGKYLPGAPLPAEAELCEQFTTSRNIIREVFRALMAKRLIEMKRYRGAFVTERLQWNYLDSDVLQWFYLLRGANMVLNMHADNIRCSFLKPLIDEMDTVTTTPTITMATIMITHMAAMATMVTAIRTTMKTCTAFTYISWPTHWAASQSLSRQH